MTLAILAAAALGAASVTLAQITPGATMMSSSSLKLARTYEGDNFFDGFGASPDCDSEEVLCRGVKAEY